MPPGSENPALDTYIRHLEESCNESRDYIALLNQAGATEVVKRIREKIEISRQVGDIMTMGSFRGKELTLFCNGKLILKDFENRESVDAFLEELLA